MPLWTLGYPYVGGGVSAPPVASPRGNVHVPSDNRLPGRFGFGVYGAGIWIRDDCHALPQDDVCARWSIGAMPSARASSTRCRASATRCVSRNAASTHGWTKIAERIDARAATADAAVAPSRCWDARATDAKDVVIYRCTDAFGALTVQNDVPCPKGTKQQKQVIQPPPPMPAYRPVPEPVACGRSTVAGARAGGGSGDRCRSRTATGFPHRRCTSAIRTTMTVT